MKTSKTFICNRMNNDWLADLVWSRVVCGTWAYCGESQQEVSFYEKYRLYIVVSPGSDSAKRIWPRSGQLDYRRPDVYSVWLFTWHVWFSDSHSVIYSMSGYHPFDEYGDLSEPDLLEKIINCDYNFDDPVWEDISEARKHAMENLVIVSFLIPCC